MTTKTISQLPLAPIVPEETLFEVEINGVSHRMTIAGVKAVFEAGYVPTTIPAEVEESIRQISETVKSVEQALGSATTAAEAAKLSEIARQAAVIARGVTETNERRTREARDDARTAYDGAASAMEGAQSAAETAGQRAVAAAGFAETASGQVVIARQVAEDSKQSALIAKAEADIASTNAGQAVVSASSAASSEKSAEESKNSAATSANVSATTYNKVITATGNEQFDNGMDGWIFTDNMFVTPSALGRINVATTKPGEYGIPQGRKVPVTADDQRFRLRASWRSAAGGAQTYYFGVVFYDAEDKQVAATDGTGNYPLGAAVVLDSGIHGWLDREAVIGRGVNEGANGGTTSIPAGAAYFRPVMYINYQGLNPVGITQVDYFTVEDVTSEYKAATYSAASAKSSQSAAASETAAGQRASAASESALEAGTKAGQASASARSAATSESNAGGSANSASESRRLAAESAEVAGTKASASATSASQAETKATEAGQSASAARQDRLDAQTAVDKASASAAVADAKSVIATDAAAAAHASSEVIASYVASTLRAAEFEPAYPLDKHWTNHPASTTSFTKTGTALVSEYGNSSCLYVSEAAGLTELYSIATYTVDTSRRYRISARVGAYFNGGSGRASRCYIGVVCLDGAGNVLDHSPYGTYRYSAFAGVLISDSNQMVVHAAVMTGEGNDSLLKFAPGTKKIKICIIVNYDNAGVYTYVDYVRFVDAEGEQEVIDTAARIKETTDALARADAAFAEQARLIEASLSTVDSRIGAKAEELTRAYAEVDRGLATRQTSLEATLNNPGGVLARLATAENTLVDAPNRYAAADRVSTLEAQVNFATDSGLQRTVNSRIEDRATAIASAAAGAVAETVETLRSEYDGTAAIVTTQAGTIATSKDRTSAYLKQTALAGDNRAYFTIYADSNAGAGWALGGDGLIDGNLNVNGTITARKFNRLSMAQESTSSWSGSITPGFGETILVPWSISLGSIPAGQGRFIYEYSFVIDTNADQSLFLGYDEQGRPRSQKYVGDGGLVIVARDGQGNPYYPRPNASDRVISTTDFAPTFTATVSRGTTNYTETDSENVITYISATYTLRQIILKLTWVAI